MKSTRSQADYKYMFPIIAAALLAGLTLGICAADIFIPLFWERRWFIKLGFLAPMAILQAALLLRTFQNLSRRKVGVAPAARYTWIFGSIALVLTSLSVIRGAWIHQAAVTSVELAQRGRPQPHPAADYTPEFAFLILFVIFLGTAHWDWINQRLNAERRFFVTYILPAALLSLVVGVSLSICIAEFLIPSLWAQPWTIRLACIAAASILEARLLFPTVEKAAREVGKAAPMRERVSWILVTTILVLTSSLVIGGAWSHLVSIAEVNSAAGIRPPAQLAPDSAPNFAFLAAFAIFLGMTHADLISRRINPEDRTHFALGFLSLCFMGIYFANNLLPAIDTSGSIRWLNFNLAHGFTSLLPVGHDFRYGLYLSAQRLVSGVPLYGITFYPPLVAALGLPYLLFPETEAYIIHVSVLVAANILALALAMLLARQSWAHESHAAARQANTIHLVVFVLIAFNLLSGYPLAFSLERGNIDVLAIVFSLASMVVLLRAPGRIWYQVILLTIAVHIKIYPALLFAVLFAVNGRRMLVPTLLVNLAFLLFLGPDTAIGFFRSLLKYYVLYPVSFNHSALSFAGVFVLDYPVLSRALPFIQIIAVGVPLAIWILAWWALARLPKSVPIAAPAFMISVPLMATSPTISYDYQLVILSSALVILLSRVLLSMTSVQRRSDYLQLFAISGLTLVFGRSDALMGSTLRIVQDKYLWIVLLQLLMLVSILRQVRESRAVNRPASQLL